MPPGAALPNAGDANDGLPEWLRPLQPGAFGAPPPGSNQLPPPPATLNQPAPYSYNQQPSYNQFGSNQPGGAVNGFGQPPQQSPQWQQAQQAPQQHFSMGSLVSDDALPEWLRQAGTNLAPQGQPPAAGWGAPPAAPSPAAQPQYNSVSVPTIPAYGGYGQNNQYGYGAPGGPAYGAGGMPQGQPLPSTPYGQMPPAAPSSGAINGGTPAGSLFDESALPDWMRQAGGQSPAAPAAPYQQMPGSPGAGYGGYQGYQPPSQPAPQPPSSAFPSIDRAGVFQPAPQPQGGLAGQSLLDPAALPQWLGGQAGSPAQSGYGGASPSGGMAAQSLVDESALPQWLRAQPDAPTPAAPSMPAFGAAAPAQAGGWNAAPAAEEPLPPWLSQVYSDAKVPRTDALHQQASANPWGANGGYRSSVSGPLAGGSGAGRAGGVPQSDTGGVPASQFVDESALPEWLRAQGAAPIPAGAQPPASPMSPMSPMPASDARAIPSYVPSASAGTPDARPGGMSFSASDLIDPDMLPQWARGENGSAAAGNNPPQQATFSSTAGWTSNGSSVPGSGILPPPPPAPSTSAASWQHSGASDRLPAWQSELSSGQGASRSYGASLPGSGQLLDDGARFGGGRRQGGGIPQEELPPWLQQAEPPRAPNPSMDAGRQRMPAADQWSRAPQQQDPGAWDNGYAEGGADFAWDDNQYAGGYDEQGYAYDQSAQNASDSNAYGPNGYDDYDPNGYDPNGYDPNAYDPNGYDNDAPPVADERSGGWRRLFGRR
ncbi:MAG: hypothetical protein ACXVCX_01665 [Ktedonobacterales bacterium]